jgi:hypothetical protein
MQAKSDKLAAMKVNELVIGHDQSSTGLLCQVKAALNHWSKKSCPTSPVD